MTKCITHINDEHVDNADNLNIIMSTVTNDGNPDDVSTVNSTSFKHKSSLIKKSATVDNNRVFENVKIAAPVKYLSNLWRSLEMSLISCKAHLELNWSKDCAMSTTPATTFKITNIKLFVLILTLSSKDNVKLVKLLKDGFKRTVFFRMSTKQK